MSERAYITPSILKWARESAKITIENAASKIPCTTDKISEWESSNCKDFPTIPQAEKLAKLYRRPLAVFYLPIIPKDFETLRDFRSNKKGDYSTALIFMMREIQEKQSWIRTIFSENYEKTLNFVGKFTKNDSTQSVAEDIRETLGIKTNEITSNALKYWIGKAERKRIFISLSSYFHTRLKLDSDEVKGFAIADKLAPFIFLNSEDWQNAQLFTLVHELAHIWINESGVSNETEINFRDRDLSEIDPIEVFCNKVAANALIPESELKTIFSEQKNISFQTISNISRRFGVSNVTLIIRAYNLNLISKKQFNEFKKESDEQFNEYLAKQENKKEPEGGPNYYILQMRRNSKAFAQIVCDFYRGGHISGLDASHLLNIKLNKFQKFEQYLYK